MSQNTYSTDEFSFSVIEDCYNTCQEYYERIIRRKSYDDLEDAVDMHLNYIERASQLEDLISQHSKDMSEEELNLARTFESMLYYCDQRLNLHISKLVAKSNEQATKASKKGLINQLSIFSMFLTILTFVLNNSKLFSMENISFSLIMAGNVSFILMCVVIFSMIYVFLHLDDNKEEPGKRIARVLIIVGFVVVLSGLVFLLTKNADINTPHSIDPKVLLRVSDHLFENLYYR